ncbi:fasciculation and elongation protein zeta-2-like [Notothenia coriiceps]|uniref:Fasciculation and elongation protein zeta-2-like n=1 Tax=Notothenia coriiceps TaxID=8208 RepID=A0A6I9Q3N5_9TELE|nr:PREDICTED: fasciculation and elongation protein zeta-2-like [Notothenia coriiceps]
MALAYIQCNVMQVKFQTRSDQESAFAKVKESQRMSDEGKMDQGEADGIRKRCRTVGFALQAEMSHFHQQREVDFKQMMQAYLTEQIAFYQRVVQQLERTLRMVWNALTDNYGNVMAVDWKTSHTRSLHLPTLNITEHEKLDNQSLDLSDDEELREQMDMHSIIVSCISDEPLYTAEQVIEEIEEMMQESPDPEDDESPSQSDLSMLSQDFHCLKRSGSNTSYEDRLRQLSVSELTETLEEVETAIRRYSEELIQALALRDELDYEKEVKNSFISLLIDVQNRQKEHRDLLRKKKKIRSTTTTGPNGRRTASTHIPGTNLTLEGLSNVIQNGLRQTFGSTGGDKQYLTTVIPYEKKAGSPPVDDLQILTKILHAMRDDSEKVPALLTDYILKVLCPT